TGATVWQLDEPGGDSGREKQGEKTNWVGSWSTPILIKVNRREELIMTWPKPVAAYDPKAGKGIGTGGGLNRLAYTTHLDSAGDRLYVINHSGDAFVLKASPKFELLATNSLGETDNASLAVSDGDIFIRTHKALWCLCENGEKRRARRPETREAADVSRR